MADITKAFEIIRKYHKKKKPKVLTLAEHVRRIIKRMRKQKSFPSHEELLAIKKKIESGHPLDPSILSLPAPSKPSVQELSEAKIKQDDAMDALHYSMFHGTVPKTSNLVKRKPYPHPWDKVSVSSKQDSLYRKIREIAKKLPSISKASKHPLIARKLPVPVQPPWSKPKANPLYLMDKEGGIHEAPVLAPHLKKHKSGPTSGELPSHPIYKEENQLTVAEKHSYKSVAYIKEQKTQRAKMNACYITEIINDLEGYFGPSLKGYKFGEMLLSWQKERMDAAGFKTMDELKEYFFEHVGRENWNGK